MYCSIVYCIATYLITMHYDWYLFLAKILSPSYCFFALPLLSALFFLPTPTNHPNLTRAHPPTPTPVYPKYSRNKNSSSTSDSSLFLV